jgi:Leucine-rich repeat (LRR) protein
LDIRNGFTLPEFVATDNATKLDITQFAASSQRLFITTTSGHLHALDLRWPRSEITWHAHSDAISALCVSERDERVFTGGRDGVCRVYDVAQIARSRPRANSTLINTNRCRAVFVGHTGAIIDMLFANDLLYTASADMTLRVWSDKAGIANPCLLLISINRDLSSFRLAVSHRQIFLYAPTAKSVLVLDETSGKVLHKLHGHTAGVHHVVSDGFAYMITCSADGTMRKWSVRSGACLAELTGHRGAVTHALVFENCIYSGSSDGSVREWANLDLSAREAALVAANVFDVPSLSRMGTHTAQASSSGAADAPVETRARNFTVLRAKLERLDLSNRHLRKILLVPKDAANMDLLELYISGNMLTVAPRNLLKENPRMRVLAINNNSLQALALPRMSALTMLSVSYNRIKELPSDFGRLLPSLKVLSVDHNPALKALPDSLMACTMLEKLNASHCTLSRLPTQLERLIGLTELDVTHNRLYKLPPRVGDLRKLRVFKFSDNQITDLPGSILRLFSNTSLAILELQGNPFSFPLEPAPSLAALEAMLRRAFDPTRDAIGDFGRPLPQRPSPSNAPVLSGHHFENLSQAPVIVSDRSHVMPATIDDDEGPQDAGLMSIDANGIAKFAEMSGPAPLPSSVTLAASALPSPPLAPRVPSMRDSASVSAPSVPIGRPPSRRRRANADAATDSPQIQRLASSDYAELPDPEVLMGSSSVSSSQRYPLPQPPMIVDALRIEPEYNEVPGYSVLPEAGTLHAETVRELSNRAQQQLNQLPGETITVLPPPSGDSSVSTSMRSNMRPADSQYGHAGFLMSGTMAASDIDNVSESDANEEERVEYDDIVIAQHDYIALRPAELSFSAGDQIQVFDRDKSGWWRGMVLGRADVQVGLFPSTYTSELVIVDVDSDSMRLLDQAIASGTQELKSLAELAASSGSNNGGDNKIARGISSSGTLELDMLKALAEGDSARQVTSKLKAAVATAQTVKAAAAANATTSTAASASLSQPPSRPPPTVAAVVTSSSSAANKAAPSTTAAPAAESKSKEIVEAAHAYKARKPKELSFEKGDKVVVTRKVQERGWWFGSILEQPQRMGFFPSTYVRKARVSQVVAAQRGRSPTLEHIDGREAAMATHDYDAEESSELTLRRYDILDVLKKNHRTGWWKGMLRGTGAVGWFPSVLVEFFPQAQAVPE